MNTANTYSSAPLYNEVPMAVALLAAVAYGVRAVFRVMQLRNYLMAIDGVGSCMVVFVRLYGHLSVIALMYLISRATQGRRVRALIYVTSFHTVLFECGSIACLYAVSALRPRHFVFLFIGTVLALWATLTTAMRGKAAYEPFTVNPDAYDDVICWI